MGRVYYGGLCSYWIDTPTPQRDRQDIAAGFTHWTDTSPPAPVWHYPSFREQWENEEFARLRDKQDRACSFKWLSEFEAKPASSSISDTDLGMLYERMRLLREIKREQQGVVKRAVVRFYTTLLKRGRAEEVAQNLTWDTRDRRIVHEYCFVEVLKLMAKRDPETLDLHQPLVQQLVRFRPFSRQGPEMPKPLARKILDILPEDSIGKVPQRRAALRILISDEERRLKAASLLFPSRYEVSCIMSGVPDRAFPQPLAEAFGGRGRSRYTGMLIQNLAPECQHIWYFNNLCDQWNHVPSATDVVLALQATELKEVKRCGLIFFDQSSLDKVQQTISRIPTEAGRQQVRDVVASALIRKSTSSAETDGICRIFNHQRTLEDVRGCVHGHIDRLTKEAKSAVRSLAEGYRHALGL